MIFSLSEDGHHEAYHDMMMVKFYYFDDCHGCCYENLIGDHLLEKVFVWEEGEVFYYYSSMVKMRRSDNRDDDDDDY
jgi:hypothetical protein